MDGGYDGAVKEDTVRHTLVFGLKSNKVYKGAVALGNTLTLGQVFNLAKIE